MEDKWKDLIGQNKEKFQKEFTLPSGHEDRFLSKLKERNKQQPKEQLNYWKVAAIFIPIAMLATYFFLEFSLSTTDTVENEAILAAYSPDLNEAKNYFSYIVQQKIEEVKALETSDNRLFIDHSMTSLNELQKDYNRLLIDLKESGGNAQVVRSILQNLQFQVELLENVLSQIESIQNLKTKQNETI